ncbi:MAG TPA: AAA family ATPase [Aurantimonas coralicida]|uniref:AAA family ATPase n=1 Tax=Aurantimonas coralicida TaxID=182270 RepID=A0A9C9THM3_9HYPH|nr:AAA family ATPase [Aurantimonas coralicida]
MQHSNNANDPADLASITSVQDLVLLRTTVENWAEEAADAVCGFAKDDGSFRKDSKSVGEEDGKAAPHITTSARAYIALLYADRLKDTSKGKLAPSWSESFKKLAEKPIIGRAGHRLFEVRNREHQPDKIDPYEVNTFDIAHLADFIQVADYLSRFHGVKVESSKFFDKATTSDILFDEKEEGQKVVARTMAEGQYDDFTERMLIETRLREAIKDASVLKEVGVGFAGEVRFEEGRPESRHYFATLHSLRALHALGVEEIDGLSAVVAGARSFAIEQSYYFQRGVTHKQDPVRLAFAGCIYAIYDEHVDKDLCLAIVESLAAAQQENGSWPATHPVFRKKNAPWHIASHEVALCLSWLYFQPRVPDAARPLIVAMMRKYFVNGVIPTFYQASKAPKEKTASTGSTLNGWQDDHTVSPDTTLGWATAIVCHFLSGFVNVLNDWINRRVIEELDLELGTKHYLIDDTASSPSRRWTRGEGPYVWPDLPPHGWAATRPTSAKQQQEIEDNWTDPEVDAAISKSIVLKVLAPILESPSEQPQHDRCAGILPGSPGTRKTSLVKEIARLARWPMVAVPAASIFQEGFDRMEARANHVFGLLNHLRGCVIFFDEFEEFFLSRGEEEPQKSNAPATATACKAASNEETPAGGGVGDAYKSRTIAAFTTSAMLPRLQDLHDKARCLIFLATNHDWKIDSAIKRAGRFDFTITVDHPTLERLQQYLKELNKKTKKMTNLGDETDDNVAKLLEAVRSAVGKSPQQRLRFSIVEETLRKVRPISGRSVEDLEKAAASSIQKQVEASGHGNPPELTTI